MEYNPLILYFTSKTTSSEHINQYKQNNYFKLSVDQKFPSQYESYVSPNLNTNQPKRRINGYRIVWFKITIHLSYLT